LTIPSSVTGIGSFAFHWCYKLIEVYDLSSLNVTASSQDNPYAGQGNGYAGYYSKVIHHDLSEPSILTTTADGYIFSYMDGQGYLVGYSGSETDLVLPSSFEYNGTTVTTYEIYPYAFYGNYQLTSVVIPDGVTSINEWAFSYTSLSSVTIPGSVTSIGYCAFNGCNSLISVTIEDGVTSIGDDAFTSCSSLAFVTIPDSVTSIGYEAFYYCSSLTAVYISTTGWYYTSDSTATSGTSVDLSNPVTAAENYLNSWSFSTNYYKRNP
jgi:hypothetical protein